MPPQIRIDVWEDFTCPFSFIEEKALEDLHEEYGDALVIERHPFELRRKRVEPGSMAARELDTLWRAAVLPLADRRHIRLNQPAFWPASRHPLETAEFARSKGRYPELHRRLFEAFFNEGRDIEDPGVLREIAIECGLDVLELDKALESGELAATLRKETGDAERLGIDSAPTLLVRSARGTLSQALRMPGAVEPRTVKNALEHMLKMQTPRSKPVQTGSR